MDSIDFSLIRIPDFNANEVERLEQISGGGNNRVFKLVLKDGTLRILKHYFRHPGDTRNRLDTEFGAFSFLWKNGVRSIPEPLGCDPNNGYALYEYLAHEASARDDIGTNDVEQAVRFTETLSELAQTEEANLLAPASEACFSLDELLAVIGKRLAILRSVDGAQNPAQKEFRDYLEKQLEPGHVHAEKHARKLLKEGTRRLERPLQTLSPSDFGFHNGLRKSDRTWIFQDFEYFGWDDPAKLIIDFELHPAMNLSEPLRQKWREGTRSVFARNLEIDTRLRALYPLYVTKWCIILLNEFVPEYRARRKFASTSNEDLRSLQLRQLEKAQSMLGRHY